MPCLPARASVAAVAAALLAGCVNLAPPLARPEPPVASAFPRAETAGDRAVGRRPVDIPWAEFFADPRLRALIDSALANNRDLRQAALRVEEARAIYRVQFAAQLPTLSGTASAGRSRAFSPLIPGGGGTFLVTQYQVGLAATSFELDFFSRIRNLSEAAFGQFLASGENARAVQLALVGQVARQYLVERALDEQRELALRSLATRESSLSVTRQRYDRGVTSGVELRQAESLVESARATVAALERQQAQALNALVRLTGTPDLADAPAGRLADQLPVTDLSAGMPSELLTNRPDIRAAEAQLAAANANIGAARAAFFPQIALTGTAGRVSTELGGLFGSGRGFTIWSFLPQVTLPIFDGGRNRANLDLTEIRRDLGVAAYEVAIQNAFREVADALVAREALERELAAQRAQRDAERARLALVEQQRGAGVANELTYLDAQRQSFAAEQSLVQAALARATNIVDLYVALGGGSNPGGPSQLTSSSPAAQLRVDPGAPGAGPRRSP